MGLFGIKTKKEKEAEARKATAAKKEAEILDSVKYWDYEHCRKELEAYENGDREYSYKVVSAIKSRKTKVAIENGENSKRRELDRKIAAQEAEVKRLEGTDRWKVTGGAGGYFATRSTESDKELDRRIESAKRELARLRRERDNIGKSW